MAMESIGRRMDAAMGKLPKPDGKAKSSIEDLFIRHRIKKGREDTEKGLMILCGGDMTQYNQLKRSTVLEYINKLDNFAESIPKETDKA